MENVLKIQENRLQQMEDVYRSCGRVGDGVEPHDMSVSGDVSGGGRTVNRGDNSESYQASGASSNPRIYHQGRASGTSDGAAGDSVHDIRF